MLGIGFGLAFFLGQSLLLFLLGFLLLQLLLIGQLFLALGFFALGLLPLGFFVRSLFLFFFLLQAFLFLLLQAFAAFVFLALQLLLVQAFLFFLLALFMALQGDVGLVRVWLCLAWRWGGRRRRGGRRFGGRHGRWWWRRWREYLAWRCLLRDGGPELGFHGGLVGAGFPLHAPGQRADEDAVGEHRQGNGAQPPGRAGGGELVAFVQGLHGRGRGAWPLRTCE